MNTPTGSMEFVPVEESTSNLTQETTLIVTAYLEHNPTTIDDIPRLIRTTYDALRQATKEVSEPQHKPAIPVDQSVHDDYLICLEDGKKFKSLKRHLSSKYNMSPDDYRTKWNLPPNYPMVAPAYAKHRSTLAKRMGLGRKWK